MVHFASKKFASRAKFMLFDCTSGTFSLDLLLSPPKITKCGITIKKTHFQRGNGPVQGHDLMGIRRLFPISLERIRTFGDHRNDTVFSIDYI